MAAMLTLLFSCLTLAPTLFELTGRVKSAKAVSGVLNPEDRNLSFIALSHLFLTKDIHLKSHFR